VILSKVEDRSLLLSMLVAASGLVFFVKLCRVHLTAEDLFNGI